MTNPRSEMILQELRTQARGFCNIADSCPHIGRKECAECHHNIRKIKSKGNFIRN